ncbi:MAG: beta-hexosaminidase [Clostridia bacterium]|nr:beta-hexosaminidase [Clostridia bacterium]
MKIKMTALLALILMFALVFTACGSDTKKDDTSDDASQKETIEEPELTAEEALHLRACEIVDSMTTEERAAQIFLVRFDRGAAQELTSEYCPGGYILFGKDFENETPDSIRELTSSLQADAKIPLILGVDEEGGTVVRVSRWEAFRPERFKSPQTLYQEGGLELIASDAKEKSELLLSLGLNMNLAPVCDVSVDPSDFMYDRAFGKDAPETAEFVSTVCTEMKKAGILSVLKHFPGYGGNVDTHTGLSVDDRPYEWFVNGDFLPFKAGADAGADFIMVSHNSVLCMDEEYPASLSKNVHDILRSELSFDGAIITDDLVMGAIGEFASPEEAAVLAVNAGNDMLISSDFETQYNAVTDAVNNGTISEDRLYDAALHVVKAKLNSGIIK